MRHSYFLSDSNASPATSATLTHAFPPFFLVLKSEASWAKCTLLHCSPLFSHLVRLAVWFFAPGRLDSMSSGRRENHRVHCTLHKCSCYSEAWRNEEGSLRLVVWQVWGLFTQTSVLSGSSGLGDEQGMPVTPSPSLCHDTRGFGLPKKQCHPLAQAVLWDSAVSCLWGRAASETIPPCKLATG